MTSIPRKLTGDPVTWNAVKEFIAGSPEGTSNRQISDGTGFAILDVTNLTRMMLLAGEIVREKVPGTPQKPSGYFAYFIGTGQMADDSEDLV